MSVIYNPLVSTLIKRNAQHLKDWLCTEAECVEVDEASLPIIAETIDRLKAYLEMGVDDKTGKFIFHKREGGQRKC